ncbi:hypothetical protein L198_00297 [Cryptococcus wingfieldii CBS 7118]|uniref:Zn(2)-C6 fungal-type domain-containing protein n=1 Tax=Cryptococcus wingfieldii CBS 7118 TaxID=1295528 RepID=A0A1E3K7R0_9TREE|nr:hypothetical protein L198_00297 [Cryptococcus wingfieldii CBS 7118]ODO08567.1 hypothetical protein L198_00297 [Cryptococcus wingfieldii CBS 7118]
MSTASAPVPVPNSDSQSSSSDSFGSPGSGPRRQRISMACAYCRHRKIRCCGGDPCRNCQRSKRECGYAPVPEEVNRATREKKAFAKANKIASQFLPPATTTSPYYAPHASYDHSVYGSPLHSAPYSHRRSSSLPSADVPWGSAPVYGSGQSWVSYAKPAPYHHRPSAPTPVYESSYGYHHQDSSQGYHHNQLGVHFEHGEPQHVLDSPSPTSTNMSSTTSAVTHSSLEEEQHAMWMTPGLVTPTYGRPAASRSLSQSVHGVPLPSDSPVQKTHSQGTVPITPASSTFARPLPSPTVYSYSSQGSAHYDNQAPIFYSPVSNKTRGDYSSPMIGGGLSKEPIVGLGLIDGRGVYMGGHYSGEEYMAPPMYYQS